jgi:endonuclease V-like protein UPF0215 family
MDLETLVRCDRTIRAIGFDDAPFVRHAGGNVPIAGVVCAGTRFEGMVWGEVEQDGWDASDRICELLLFKCVAKNRTRSRPPFLDSPIVVKSQKRYVWRIPSVRQW